MRGNADFRHLLDNDAGSDLWRNTLSKIDSVLGRLHYLSSLRDQNSGHYEHFGLAQIWGRSVAREALRQAHYRTFLDWLCLSLREQSADLELYLSTLEMDRKTVLRQWAQLAPYWILIPAEACAAERELYLADLRILVEALNNSYAECLAEARTTHTTSSPHSRRAAPDGCPPAAANSTARA